MKENQINRVLGEFIKSKTKHPPKFLNWNALIPVYKKVAKHWSGLLSDKHSRPTVDRWINVRNALLKADMTELRASLYDYIKNIQQ